VPSVQQSRLPTGCYGQPLSDELFIRNRYAMLSAYTGRWCCLSVEVLDGKASSEGGKVQE
jgi:hypothetical protein